MPNINLLKLISSEMESVKNKLQAAGVKPVVSLAAHYMCGTVSLKLHHGEYLSGEITVDGSDLDDMADELIRRHNFAAQQKNLQLSAPTIEQPVESDFA